MKKLDKISDNLNGMPDFVLANRRNLAIRKLRYMILTYGYDETKSNIVAVLSSDLKFEIDCLPSFLSMLEEANNDLHSN